MNESKGLLTRAPCYISLEHITAVSVTSRTIERMEGEISNFIKLWATLVASLTYCYYISSKIPKGKFRLLSLLPIISAFMLLPLTLSSVAMQFYLGLFIGWQANFKLLLFAFGKDVTLTVNPSMSLLQFILVTTLPIKIQKIPSQNNKLYFNSTFIINTILWSLCVQVYVKYKHTTLLRKQLVVHLLYTGRMYFSIQVYFEVFAAIAKSLLGEELEPQFNNPHLSTSLQDFWGRRWNLMFHSVLKSTIHEPTKSFFISMLGKRWALHPAILVTFAVSGLMHELVYFYVGHRWPTWEVQWFFMIHGVCLAVEIEVKKIASRKGWRLPWMMSVALTAGFFISTSMWLLFTELIHWGADVREVEDYSVIIKCVKNLIQAQ